MELSSDALSRYGKVNADTVVQLQCSIPNSLRNRLDKLVGVVHSANPKISRSSLAATLLEEKLTELGY